MPEAEVAAERETIEKIALNEGKPEAALPKIVEGRLNGWYKERVLLDQPFVKDEKQTIGKLLGDGHGDAVRPGRRRRLKARWASDGASS